MSRYRVERNTRCFGGNSPQWSSWFGNTLIWSDSPTKGEAMRRNREHQAANSWRVNIGSRLVPNYMFGPTFEALNAAVEDYHDRNNMRMRSFIYESNT